MAENFVNWINDNIVDTEDKIDKGEYKNYEQKDADFKKIKDYLTGHAKTPKQKISVENVFDDEVKPKFLEPEINEAIKTENERIITERKEIIQKATTISEIEKAEPIEINYLDETSAKISEIAETRQEELYEEQIDEARGMIIGVGSVEEIREVLRMLPSEIRDKVGAKQKLDRLIRAGLEEEGTTIGRIS